MRYLITFLSILLFATTSFSKGFKAKNSDKQITAIKLESSINLDGKLNEKAWMQIPISSFTQRDPVEGQPASETTKVWVAYDESYIYIAAELLDSEAEKIDVSLARKDSWHDSDWFTVYIDPYFDRKTGYYFAVNAGGSLGDGVYYNDSWNDDSWDGIWEAKTSVDNSGWIVEMRIPFSQLRFSQADVMKWGINFKRQIKRNKENDYFVMVPKDESGFVSHFATLDGLSGIEPKQRLEVLPYISQKAQYLIHDANDPFYTGNQYQTVFGADAKIGIGTNLNLDLTVNPDFGQVEVDPAVLNLSAFETFFPEKRPFFIEGGNIFNFGYGGANSNWGFNFGNLDLFYSRRIGRSPQGPLPDNDYADYPTETRILGAAKLTGKLNESWSIGAVSAVTERTYSKYTLNKTQDEFEVEPLTHYGVLRTQKELNDGRQGIGMIITSVNRDLRTDALKSRLSDQAYTFGVDGWTFLDEEKLYVINASVVGSYTSGTNDYMIRLQKQPYRYFQRPDATFMTLDSGRTSLSGIYSRVALNKQKGNFYINSALGLISPGFENNDLGFQWMADRINGHTVLGYRWYEPDSTFRQKWVYLAHARTYDFEGNNYQNILWGRIGGQFMNYYEFGLVGYYNFETFTKTLSRGGPLMTNPENYGYELWASSDSRKNLIVNAGTSFAGDILGSEAISGWLDLQWKPSTQLSISVGPEYQYYHEKSQWVRNISDPTATQSYGTRYIFGNIDQDLLAANIRVNWTFSPQLSLQLFLQPLFAVGDYSNFKEIKTPGTLEYEDYGTNGSTIEYIGDADEYKVKPSNSDTPIYFSNPDFNFKSLRANMVIRYEILPGSIFYLVWSHDRTNFDNAGRFDLNRDFTNLWNAEANNIFVAKFSYWFDI